MAQNEDLDKLDSALFSIMRMAKRPAYWDEFQRKAGAQIDRPAAAILMSLAKCPLQFRAVVQRLGIEAPSISRKVHELERAGLIVRESAPDRRVHILALTAKGNALATKIASARRAMLEEVLSGWTSSDTKNLSQLLSRLATDLASRYGTKEIAQDSK